MIFNGFSSACLFRRNLHNECIIDNSVSRFSPDIVSQAIKNIGNDDLTIHHLKNLGTLGLQYLTHPYNLSINHCNIPAI